jgi:hypothetical protein
LQEEDRAAAACAQRRGVSRHELAARISVTARSASAIVGALVSAETIRGITEASITLALGNLRGLVQTIERNDSTS